MSNYERVVREALADLAKEGITCEFDEDNRTESEVDLLFTYSLYRGQGEALDLKDALVRESIHV